MISVYSRVLGNLPTPTPTSSSTPTNTPTQTLTPTNTTTQTPTLTETPTPTPTLTSSQTPTTTPTLSSTQTPTPTSTSYFPSFKVSNIHPTIVITNFTYGQNSSVSVTSGTLPLELSQNLINETTNFWGELSWDSVSTSYGIVTSGSGEGFLHIYFNDCVVHTQSVNGNQNFGQSFVPYCNGTFYPLMSNTEVEFVLSTTSDAYATPTPTPTQTLTPTLSATATPTPTLTPTSTPVGTGSTIVHLDGSSSSNFLNLSGQELTSTGNFKTWKDSSGYNHNAIGDSFGLWESNVKNGLGSIRCPNTFTSSYYTLTVTGLTETSTTGFTVTTIFTSSGSEYGIFTAKNSSNQNVNGGGTIQYGPNNYFYVYVGGNTYRTTQQIPYGVNETFLVTARYDGTASTDSEKLRIWVNNIERSLLYSVSVPSSETQIVTIGISNRNSSYIQGYIHEFFYDKEPLSIVNLESRDASLMTKWNFFPTLTPTQTPTLTLTSTPTSTPTPTGTPTPTPTSNLILHYDASVSTNFTPIVGTNGINFTSWLDISGYANHLGSDSGFGGTWSANTQNSLGSVIFPGKWTGSLDYDYSLATTFNDTSTNAFTSFLLMQYSGGQNWGPFEFINQSNQRGGGTIQIYNGTLFVLINGQSFSPVNSPTFTPNQAILFTIKYDGTQSVNSDRLKLWVNGYSVPFTSGTTIPTSETPITTFILGKSLLFGTQRLNGKVFEFKYYKTALSDLQINDEIDSLFTKWGNEPTPTPTPTPTLTPTTT